MPISDRRTITQVKGMALASHLGPTLAVTSITSLLALEAGRGWGTLAVGAAVLAGQCSVGWSNDSFDAARDRKAERSTKPTVAGLVTSTFLFRAALTALVVSSGLSFLSGWRAAGVHIIALGSAWTYNGWVKSTWFSPVPYALSFGLLPAFVTLGLPGHPWPRPEAIIAAGLLGLGAHFINTVNDADADELNGVDGLPQRLGVTGSLIVGVTLLGVSLVMISLLTPTLTVFSGFCLAVGFFSLVAVVVQALRGDTRHSWHWTLLTALACAVLFASSGGMLVAH